MAKHKVLSTEEDIDKALVKAASKADESTVCEVYLDNLGDGKALIIKMSDGSVHGIPKSKLEGLADSTDEVASNCKITQGGLALRWPDIDLDMFVPALLQGIYGTKTWMSSLGRLGGRARTEAKRSAARLNGLKGGRPRKRDGDRALATPSPSKQVVATQYSRRDPFRYSGGRRTPELNRKDYARLFGLDECSPVRSLPRIA